MDSRNKKAVARLRQVAWCAVAGVAYCVAAGIQGPGGYRLGVALAVALAWYLKRTERRPQRRGRQPQRSGRQPQRSGRQPQRRRHAVGNGRNTRQRVAR